MSLRETWLFWAMFLFRLSVPTMGKPLFCKFFLGGTIEYYYTFEQSQHK